jgi:FO synthase
MRYAGEQGVAFTTGILIGIGETWAERVDSLFAIRGVHEEHGNIQEVIVQNFRVKEDIPMRHRDEPSVYEMLRTIATARLVLGPAMNIQAPPNLTPDAYGQYLMAGCNDWGGVSPVTIDHISPEAPWPKLVELKEVTEEAGFDLVERLALYPEYAQQERFVRDGCRPAIERWTGASGLVREEALAW